MINFTVKLITRKEAESIIKIWHYSKGINGVIADYCFGLFDGQELIGAMIFGRLAMANQYKKYSNKAEDVIELRRLACVDNTPKNTESFFIGHALRYLKKNTNIKIVVSYADPNYNHSGIIYKASNFHYVGTTSKGKIIMWNGKKYHDKSIRTKYKGELKPFAKKLQRAIELGEAYYETQLGKHIYIYKLRKNYQCLAG